MEMNFRCGSYTQEQFIQVINAWFREHTNIRVRKMYTAESTSFGFFVNKSNVSDITILYDVDDTVNNLYGFTVYEEFSIVNISHEELKQRWLNMNPDYTIAISNYYHNMRGSTGSILLNGFMAANRFQLAIIYKYIPRAATNVPPVNQQSASAPLFCSQCGNRLSEDANFCNKCGYRIK